MSERKSCTLEQKLKATKERKEIKKRHPYLIGTTPKDEDFLVPVIEELEDKSE